MKKKLIAILLSGTMVALTACGGGNADGSSASDAGSSAGDSQEAAAQDSGDAGEGAEDSGDAAAAGELFRSPDTGKIVARKRPRKF